MLSVTPVCSWTPLAPSSLLPHGQPPPGSTFPSSCCHQIKSTQRFYRGGADPPGQGFPLERHERAAGRADTECCTGTAAPQRGWSSDISRAGHGHDRRLASLGANGRWFADASAVLWTRSTAPKDLAVLCPLPDSHERLLGPVLATVSLRSSRLWVRRSLAPCGVRGERAWQSKCKPQLSAPVCSPSRSRGALGCGRAPLRAELECLCARCTHTAGGETPARAAPPLAPCRAGLDRRAAGTRSGCGCPCPRRALQPQPGDDPRQPQAPPGGSRAERAQHGHRHPLLRPGAARGARGAGVSGSRCHRPPSGAAASAPPRPAGVTRAARRSAAP